MIPLVLIGFSVLGAAAVGTAVYVGVDRTPLGTRRILSLDATLVKKLKKEALAIWEFGPPVVKPDEVLVCLRGENGRWNKSPAGIPRASGGVCGVDDEPDQCAAKWAAAMKDVLGGDPFVVYPPGLDPNKVYLGNDPAVDVYGRTWMYARGGMWLGGLQHMDDPRYCGWVLATPKEESFWDLVEEATVKWAFPIMALAVGIFVPGVGGVIAATAIVALSKMAQGRSVTSSMAEAIADKSFSSSSSKDRFMESYKQFSSAPYLRAKVVEIANDRLASLKATNPAVYDDEKKAFDEGATLGRGAYIQACVVHDLKKRRLPMPDAPQWLDAALAQQAALHEWVYAYAGDQGLNLLGRISLLAAEHVDAGRSVESFNPSPVTSIPIAPVTPIRPVVNSISKPTYFLKPL